MNYQSRLLKSIQPSQPQPVRSKTSIIPSRGLIANENLGATLPGGASIMENWFPTAVGARLRGGTELHFVAGDADKTILSLFKYVNGSNQSLFAATEDAIYDATTAVAPTIIVDDVPDELIDNVGDTLGVPGAAEEIGSFTGGDWISCQFTTSGGTYLRLVNGEDTPLVYDGSAFGTSPAITGAAGSVDLSFVWAYKNRLFFVGKSSLDAYYLDTVDAIGGASSKFPLGAVFQLGGSLLFGASWSLNDGGGLSDNCVFVTTEGEVAVYAGDDPTSWVLVGKYQIGRPLGKRAFVRSGGDLLIATEIGVIPLSQATDKTPELLAPSALTFPIEEEWNQAVNKRSSATWFMENYPTKQMMVVGTSTVAGARDQMLVVNVRTKAWCIYTGFSAYVALTFGDGLYIGTTLGRVIRMETTGSDDGSPYTGTMAPLFDDMGTPESAKSANYIRASFRADSDPRPKLTMLYDYNQQVPHAPDAYSQTPAAVWGSIVVGTTKWGAGRTLAIYEAEKSARGLGYTLAPCVQVTSSGISVPRIEISRVEVGFELSESLS